MEAKFTKGPWAVIGSRDDGGLQICHKPSGGIVATIESTLGYAEADEANTHLIAAAPELYAVAECEEALDMNGTEGWAILERHGFDVSNRFELPATQFVARMRRAALAKARGESQA